MTEPGRPWVTGLLTLVPLVCLLVSLAGPAPSGSTRHVPSLSGLLPPPRRLPVQLPQLQPGRCDGPRGAGFAARPRPVRPRCQRQYRDPGPRSGTAPALGTCRRSAWQGWPSEVPGPPSPQGRTVPGRCDGRRRASASPFARPCLLPMRGASALGRVPERGRCTRACRIAGRCPRPACPWSQAGTSTRTRWRPLRARQSRPGPR
jgi:hypothetical protein